MKQTIKDIEKISQKSVKLFKAGVYYLTIPLVVTVGFYTMDLGRFLQQQPTLWAARSDNYPLYHCINELLFMIT